MVKTMKRRIFSGTVCEQYVYNVSDGIKNLPGYDPEQIKKERFVDEAAYEKHKENISRRRHTRVFNAAFSPTSLYSTLTFDNAHEVHTFEEARRVRDNYRRRLMRACPNGYAHIYVGRGKSTNRIHFHMVSEGIPEDVIVKKWKEGEINRIENLREHNFYDKKDCGQDYTGLANYLFDHWTVEQGGHRWMRMGNIPEPEYEEPTEVHICGGYSSNRPPVSPKGYTLTLTQTITAPEGYTLVDTGKTKYGFYYFKYVKMPPKKKSGRPPKKPD